MEAGPELDALIAEKVLGLEVLGFEMGVLNPECCCGRHTYLDSTHRITDDDDFGIRTRPSAWYLDSCVCRFKTEGEEEYFGHTAFCLRPVEPYSTNDKAAWMLIYELESRGYVLCLLDRLGFKIADVATTAYKAMWRAEFMDEGAHAADRPYEEIWLGVELASTMPHAVAMAAMNILKVRDNA